jgi:hypothetical protein
VRGFFWHRGCPAADLGMSSLDVDPVLWSSPFDKEPAMDRKLVPHHSHWGAFNAVVEDGRVVGAVPFDFDPIPRR